MNLETISFREYLIKKGISFREIHDEIITKCLFNDCDQDSRENEAHLYFNAETGQYHCKKCNEQGNIYTLAKHFRDNIKEIIKNDTSDPKNKKTQRKNVMFDPMVVDKCHNDLPQHIREYLNKRGIPDHIINKYKLGFGQFYGKYWITIPITDSSGNFIYLKLRKYEHDNTNNAKYKFFPTGSSVSLYGFEMLKNNKDLIFICEGELDRLVLISNGIPAITSTGGAGTFKSEWIDHLKEIKKIYVCFDKDETGKIGADKLIKKLSEELPNSAIYKTTLPDRMTDGKDITDYFTRYQGSTDELIYKLSSQVNGNVSIETLKFKPLTGQDIIQILGMTIKRDEYNKLATFLCQLSAYTENSQLNISFNAPSSTGKSYIPTEIASLFPNEDVIEIGYCSPTAFFHDQGTAYRKETNKLIVDLSKKILIFLDQPHTMLLRRLRPILSHDKKEIKVKITDKNQKFGTRTKNILIRGYPSVVFCSAGLRIDEQEATRFLLLSPETNQEKIRESIDEKIKKEGDRENYKAYLESNPARKLLKERIEAIKHEGIKEIRFTEVEKIKSIFLKNKIILKPRHQRDIARLLSLIKVFALLNLWFRERTGNTIIANGQDIDEAVKVWKEVSQSQEYNLPPYIYQIYQEIIIPIWQDKNMGIEGKINMGISRKELLKKHYEVYGRMLPDWQLRKQILPMLEIAGLLNQEPDPRNKKRTLIYLNS